MKKYLLSLLFIAPALFSMAGPVAEKNFTEKLEAALPNKKIEIQAMTTDNDKIIVAGMLENFTPLIARFNKDGSLDQTFNPGSMAPQRGIVIAGPPFLAKKSTINSVQVLPNGNIKITGTSITFEDKDEGRTFSSQVTKDGRWVS